MSKTEYSAIYELIIGSKITELEESFSKVKKEEVLRFLKWQNPQDNENTALHVVIEENNSAVMALFGRKIEELLDVRELNEVLSIKNIGGFQAVGKIFTDKGERNEALKMLDEMFKKAENREVLFRKLIEAYTEREEEIEDKELFDERIEALIRGLGIALERESSLINTYKAIQEFGFDFNEQTDDEILDKIEVVNIFLKMHGYLDLGEIDEVELRKLKQLYQALGNDLASLNLRKVEAVQKLKLEPIYQIRMITTEEVDFFCDFLKKLKITLSYYQLENSSNIQDLLEDLGYKGNNYLREKELKKITFFLEEFKVSQIKEWGKETKETLTLIAKEFGLNLLEIGSLKLGRKISNIKKLTFQATDSVEEVKSKLAVLKYTKEDLGNLNQFEVDKLEKLIAVLQLGNRQEEYVRSFLSWLEFKGININIEELKEECFEKIKSIIRKLEFATGKAFKDLEIATIVITEKLLAVFGVEEIVEADSTALIRIQNVISLLREGMEEQEVNNLPNLKEIFNILEIDPFTFDISKFYKINKFLKEIDMSFTMLSENEASKLAFAIVSFGDIEKLKIISNSLGFSIKDVSKEEIEKIVFLLSKMKLEETESQQSWLSYLTEGKAAAFKEKLNEISQKTEVLGYKKITDFNSDEYEGVTELLKVYGKDFVDITVSEMESLSQIYQEFGYNIATNLLFRLIAFSEVVKVFGISVFDFGNKENEKAIFQIGLMRSIMEKCQLDSDEAISQETAAKVDSILVNFEKYEECRIDLESESCRGINISALIDIEALSAIICNEYHEEL